MTLHENVSVSSLGLFLVPVSAGFPWESCSHKKVSVKSKENDQISLKTSAFSLFLSFSNICVINPTDQLDIITDGICFHPMTNDQETCMKTVIIVCAVPFGGSTCASANSIS